jgi:hypothetical protein
MSILKQITINDIRAFNPRYDLARFLPEDWCGTAVDILRVADCPPQDRLWVVLREELIDARMLRLFAVWCARQALALVDNPDPRSIAACDVAERYANGAATRLELYAARAAAWDAAWAAAGDAAWAATWTAASNAGDAAGDAAWAAAEAAIWAAASNAAGAAARAEQIDKLIEMLTEPDIV